MRILTIVAASFLFVPLLVAQQPAPRADAAVRTDDPDDEALPGQLPGTRRFNVTFADRAFDLGALQRAIRGGATAAAVDRITADLAARASAQRAPFAAAIAALGGRVERTFWLIDACTIDVAPAQLAAVRAFAGVAHVRPDRAVLPQIATATNGNNHNADAVQAQGIRGDGAAIAIVDTGQDEDMNGTGRPHRSYFRNGNTADATGGGIGGSRLLANVQLALEPADNSHPHGIGVAGIAAGEAWSTAAADRGHASAARIVGYSICNAAGTCSSSLSLEAAAWQQAVADAVRYHIVAANMSYSSSPSPIDVAQQAIDAAALVADILPVCAAANTAATTTSSSSCANGLAVANVAADSKVVAGSSSRGPLSGDPQRFFPDIAACGTATVMPLHENETANWVANGTSMASPQVCGAAVLLKTARPLLTALELKAVLLASTENIAAQNPGLDRNAYGLGFLRDDRAVALVQRPDAVLSRELASTTTPATFALAVTAGVPVSVLLAFHRHLLATTAWSDFALRVLDGATLVAQSDDPRNLYERVVFTPTTTGTLTVEVSASSLEIASVPFALATTAAFAGLGTPADWITGADGCPGSRGRPSLFATGRPRLGGALTAQLAYGNPTSLALFALGFGNATWNGTALPFDLAAQGAPGCAVRVAIDSIGAVVTDVDGTASTSYAVPAQPVFAGFVLHQQAFVLDATANALGLVASNAGRCTIGDF